MNREASAEKGHSSFWKVQAVLTRKELRETLRDRRTLVTLIAMPLLLYPLLGLVFRLVALQTKAAAGGAEYRIAAAGPRCPVAGGSLGVDPWICVRGNAGGE